MYFLKTRAQTHSEKGAKLLGTELGFCFYFIFKFLGHELSCVFSTQIKQILTYLV